MKKTVRHDKQKRERSDNKKAMRGRKEVTVAARHAEGQLCTMRCQQRRTRAAESKSRRRVRERGMMWESSDNRQQEHKYYKQFNIILMPCHVVLCLCSYAASSVTPPQPHSHTHTYIFTCVFIWHVSSVYKIERQLSMCLRHDRLLRLDSSSS